MNYLNSIVLVFICIGLLIVLVKMIVYDVSLFSNELLNSIALISVSLTEANYISKAVKSFSKL